MSLKLFLATTIAAAALGCAGAAGAADISGLYNTGVTAAGTPAAYGAAELHYAIQGGPDARVANDPSQYPDTVWIGADGASYWIGPVGDAQLDGPFRTYDYRTSFSLTGADIAATAITGRWALDDAGLDILINGISTHQTASWNNWTNFSITSGFQAGVNTLDFVIQNQNTFGPTGLRVEFDHPVNAPGGVPEPAAWALMLAGFGGLGATLRRRRALASLA